MIASAPIGSSQYFKLSNRCHPLENLDPDDTARKKGTFFSFPNGIFSVLLHRKQAMGTMLIYKLLFLNL